MNQFLREELTEILKETAPAASAITGSAVSKGNMSAYDFGSLRMAQAKALIECIGIAAEHGDDGLPSMDAVWGVIALLDDASTAFREERIAARGSA